MKLKTKEVESVLALELEAFEKELEVAETGVVIEVGDGIARVYGLRNVMANELIDFGDGVTGLALNLEEDSVGCVLFGGEEKVRKGDTPRRTGRVADVPVGEALLGRVVDPLGRPLDGRGPIETDKRRPIEIVATGVVKRQPVKEPLQTGLKAIDSMIPIGRGQRELIIGDRQTGKTAIAIDTIINQRIQMSLYLRGHWAETVHVAQIVRTLEEYGAMSYTTVIAATASDPAPLQYIAPYAGTAMGEEFMFNGKHALVIYDDLSKHAVAYRTMALLLRRPPGREAYPGDVFYLHSRLLERASNSVMTRRGSLTALPIVETQAGDVSAYIPTNVISITDGQIYLESDLFFAGQRPAVNAGLSVSRVGGSAQTKAMKKVAGRLRLDLAQYRELEAFARFGSDLDESTRERLQRGQRLLEVLKQGQYEPMPMEEQVVQLYAGINGFVDEIELPRVGEFVDGLVRYVRSNRPGILEDIKKTQDLSRETEDELRTVIEEYTKSIWGGK